MEFLAIICSIQYGWYSKFFRLSSLYYKLYWAFSMNIQVLIFRNAAIGIGKLLVWKIPIPILYECILYTLNIGTYTAAYYLYIYYIYNWRGSNHKVIVYLLCWTRGCSSWARCGDGVLSWGIQTPHLCRGAKSSEESEVSDRKERLFALFWTGKLFTL